MKIFVTGIAGFIGMHVAHALLLKNYEVVGIDNLNDYYDQDLKLARLNLLSEHQKFKFIKGDILDAQLISSTFQENYFDAVIHLAAQAGV